MILRTGRALFVTDPDETDELIEELRTEYNTQTYAIRIYKDQPSRPFYRLFHLCKEGKRQFRKELFASSKIEKIIHYFNQEI